MCVCVWQTRDDILKVQGAHFKILHHPACWEGCGELTSDAYAEGCEGGESELLLLLLLGCLLERLVMIEDKAERSIFITLIFENIAYFDFIR